VSVAVEVAAAVVKLRVARSRRGALVALVESIRVTASVVVGRSSGARRL